MIFIMYAILDPIIHPILWDLNLEFALEIGDLEFGLEIGFENLEAAKSVLIIETEI